MIGSSAAARGASSAGSSLIRSTKQLLLGRIISVVESGSELGWRDFWYLAHDLAEHAEAVLFAIEDAAATPPGLALSACERVLEMLESPDDVTRRAAAVAHQVSDLLIRAYVDANSPAEKDRALDVIDRSLEVSAYGAQRALIEHDRG